ncbi:MAG TPA: amidohydrolase, partial [Chryseolinea sp.]
MKKLLTNKILPIILLAGFMFSCDKKQTPVDMVILGGRIYTVADQTPTVEAVAVTGNKIVFTGSEIDARSLIGDNTTVIDLEGKVLTPGFIEGHGHLMG